MNRLCNIKGKAIELLVMGLVAVVVLAEGLRFVTTLSYSIGATEAGVFLIVLAGLLGLLAIIYGLQPQSAKADDGQQLVDCGEQGQSGLRGAGTGIALFFGYALLLGYVDYAISTFVFFVAYLRIFGRYRWPVIIAVSALIALGSAYLWHVLGVAMPRHDFSIF